MNMEMEMLLQLSNKVSKYVNGMRGRLHPAGDGRFSTAKDIDKADVYQGEIYGFSQKHFLK